MLREILRPYPNIEVDSFEGLTVDYALQRNAGYIVRGLRMFSDFENEFRMSLNNKKLAGLVEMIFLMAKAEYSFIYSSAVKEIASFGGSLGSFLPEIIKQKLNENFANCSLKLEENRHTCR